MSSINLDKSCRCGQHLRGSTMSSIWNVAMLILALVVVRISHWLYRWSNPKCNGKLPPGAMGFPIIGETIDFLKPCGFNDIPTFVKKRMIRYGLLFRTNIFGSKTVVSADPDVINQIFRQENTSFGLGYPDILVKVFGKDNLFLKEVFIHKYLHKVTMQIIGSEGLKQTMIGNMDKATRDHFRLKASQGSFNVRKEVENLIVAYMTPKLISNLKPETQSKLIDNLNAFNLDWFQSFFSLSSWKALIKVLKSRGEAIQVMKDVLSMRRESREKQEDFLNTLLEELDKESSIFDQGSATNLIFLLAFVAREGTSSCTALAVKFISKDPKVLAELKREHKAIVDNRKDKKAGVSWEEYTHNMTFTNMVINESLRLSNTTPLLFRKALHDVEIKGYTIPAGWIVAVAPSAVHYDPINYENPFEFNPWRWEGKEMTRGSKTFMAFGSGVRLCVGAEFARLQMAIFLL
ncbi:cytochrome P450 708A2 [Arabidopsis lyrata subsp. lyrata]|uniref:cytochrome P450 708A2 n=1 Tax=Arabidopsis lyrata subsp. lyrata TaxID=81972 RepID=UPI000A29B439|nr:cytochrome P450 708A2 [Arabidopsis lyrata subsp. lyrata]|eukprot:XP_020865762.1 cytochrome P450 708A2 [Arabidopsis lyrata subsp. lyrata]